MADRSASSSFPRAMREGAAAPNEGEAAGGRLPDFLVIGATKGGTTSLHRYLSAHPGVFMHPDKELRYFSIEHNFERGLDWYRAQFRTAPRDVPAGESSNSYTRWPIYDGVPERIAAVAPDVRLIYVIRHPLRRIESHWRHRLVTGVEWRDAGAAIHGDPSYVAVSLYGRQLERYRRFFPAERILILRAERLFGAPEEALAEVCDFLGVARRTEGFARENASSERPMVPALLRRLSRVVGPQRGRRASDAIAATLIGRRAKTADEAPFRLSRESREMLKRVFEEDQRRLAALAGDAVADYNLDETNGEDEERAA